jgi:RNA polymerase sigma factor (sigma-70 family)
MNVTKAETQLRRFIDSEHQTIKRHLRMYILNWGLAAGAAVEDETDRLLSDVVYEALQHQHRYDASRSPLAWLLGIGVNLIRRRLASPTTRREIVISDLYTADSLMSPEEIIERYLPGVQDQRLERLEDSDSWNERLGTLSDIDRAIVNGKYQDEQSAKDIAADLGMKPAAIRKRLSRILQYLRQKEGLE